MERIRAFERDGLIFDVTDEGPQDGPVVLLLHGFPADRSSFAEVTPGLVNAGYRTLAFDQRGYSPRARPRGRTAYRGRELVRDALALLDTAGVQRASVVGHDWGGIVAWWLAMAAPRRIDHLVVVSTPHPSALRDSLLRSDQALRSSYMALFQIPVLPEALLRPRLHSLLTDAGVPPRSADSYQATLGQPGALTAALNWYRALLLPGGGRAGRDDRIRVPTRYVWGNRDAALGRRAAELTREYVDGPYRFVEMDENHWIPERAPARLAHEILSELGGAAD